VPRGGESAEVIEADGVDMGEQGARAVDAKTVAAPG